MSLFEAGIMSLYHGNETGRMIFGVFGEAINQSLGLWVVGNLFSLRFEAKPYACHFHREWCARQVAQEAGEFFNLSLAELEEGQYGLGKIDLLVLGLIQSLLL